MAIVHLPTLLMFHVGALRAVRLLRGAMGSVGEPLGWSGAPSTPTWDDNPVEARQDLILLLYWCGVQSLVFWGCVFLTGAWEKQQRAAFLRGRQLVDDAAPADPEEEVVTAWLSFSEMAGRCAMAQVFALLLLIHDSSLDGMLLML
jgi:hypothetical protein